MPFDACSWQAAGITVGREDVNVTGVKGRDGDGAAPEDEVLCVLSDLAQGKYVTLADLVETGKRQQPCLRLQAQCAAKRNLRLCRLGEANKFDHGRCSRIRVCLQFGNDFSLVLHKEQSKIAIQKPRFVQGILVDEGIGTC